MRKFPFLSYTKYLLMILLLAPIPKIHANLVFEFLWGISWQLPSTMTEYGLGSPIVYHPTWETRSLSSIFDDSPYWAARNGIWNNKHTWAIEVEWIHQKIFLVDENSHIQKLDISHGYNLLLVNYAHKIYVQKYFELIFRVGLGPVIAYAEMIVDGIYGGTGRYYGDPDTKAMVLAGLGGQIAFQFRFTLADYLIGTLELKYTAGYANVPYSGKINPEGGKERNNLYLGQLHVPQQSIQLTWGFGLDFYQLFHYKTDYRKTAQRASGLSIRTLQEIAQKNNAKKLKQ